MCVTILEKHGKVSPKSDELCFCSLLSQPRVDVAVGFGGAGSAPTARRSALVSRTLDLALLSPGDQDSILEK